MITPIPWEHEWHDDHDLRKGGQAPRVGMSYGEIAEELGIAKASVRHIEKKALDKIRHHFEDWR